MDWIGVGLGAPFQISQDGCVAHRHAEAGHQPFRRASAGAVAEKPDNPSQSSGSARERGGERGKALGEDPPFTSIVSTSPAGHSRPNRDRLALRGKILESPSIRTMTRNRLNATEGARRVIQPVHRNDPICLVPLDRQDL
jgi:hypothetical protein